jgi:hypothetical protein
MKSLLQSLSIVSILLIAPGVYSKALTSPEHTTKTTEHHITLTLGPKVPSGTGIQSLAQITPAALEMIKGFAPQTYHSIHQAAQQAQQELARMSPQERQTICQEALEALLALQILIKPKIQALTHGLMESLHKKSFMKRGWIPHFRQHRPSPETMLEDELEFEPEFELEQELEDVD